MTNHPGQLSLAIPPWIGTMITSQWVLMLCSWGVKAGMQTRFYKKYLGQRPQPQKKARTGERQRREN